MNSRIRVNSGAGFTLVEMLAAVISVVVILSAAIGFLLTAIERQHSFLQGSELESQHDNLEELLFASVKTADDFQIFPGPSTTKPVEGDPGVAQGNLLVCWKDGQPSVFEFAGNQIILSQSVPRKTSVRFINCTLADPPNLFRMRLGVIEASWNVNTQSESIPYHVYAMPLALH